MPIHASVNTLVLLVFCTGVAGCTQSAIDLFGDGPRQDGAVLVDSGDIEDGRTPADTGSSPDSSIPPETGTPADSGPDWGGSPDLGVTDTGVTGPDADVTGPDAGTDGGVDLPPTIPLCPAQDILFTACHDGASSAFYWTGELCARGWGCGAGGDSGRTYPGLSECMDAHTTCRVPSCEAQDITITNNTCEDFWGASWNGTDCVELRGCGLDGDNIGQRFADFHECQNAQTDCHCTPTSCGPGLVCGSTGCVAAECGSETQLSGGGDRPTCNDGHTAVIRDGAWQCVNVECNNDDD